MIEALLSRAGHAAARLYAEVVLDTQVEWWAPLPEGARILAANHPTTSDPFCLLALLPDPLSLLITEAAFCLPGTGRLLRAAGHVPAVRGSGGGTVDALRSRIARGWSVGIFPEGALSPAQGGLHPPHTGAARLALCTGAPVIPVGIAVDGAQVRPFTVRIAGRSERGRLYLSGRYYLTVGQPLLFRGSIEDRALVRAVAAQISERIALAACDSARRLNSAAGAHRNPAWPGTALPALAAELGPVRGRADGR